MTQLSYVTLNETFTPKGATAEQTETLNLTVFQLESQDGCYVTIRGITTEGYYLSSWAKLGGGWWSGPPYYNSSISYQNLSDSSGTCGDRTMFFIDTGSQSPQPNRFRAHFCSTGFYAGIATATVQLNKTSTVVTLDEDEYSRNAKQLNSETYRTSQLVDAFISPHWTSLFIQSEFAGPLLALASSPDYDSDPVSMINSTSLMDRASKLFQHFFGEMLLMTLQRNSQLSIDPASSQLESKAVIGKSSITERRIVASLGIGITIGSLFVISGFCIAVVAYNSRVCRRPLNLFQDPGTIAAAASTVIANDKARAIFEDSDQLSTEELILRLKAFTFSFKYGNLILGTSDRKVIHDGEILTLGDSPRESSTLTQSDQTTSTKVIPGREDPRPAVLRSSMGLLLVTILVALLASLIVLYSMSRTGGIYQSAFVYQLNLPVGTFAPYSILTTLLAILVKLWFGAVSDTLKRLEPYVSATKEPITLSRSVLAEYVNTPIAIAMFKAVKHSHWTLALIGLGAFATEACKQNSTSSETALLILDVLVTVGMSALWDRETRIMDRPHNISRQYELRYVPRIFEQSTYAPDAPPDPDPKRTTLLQTVYQTSSLQSWLYGAALEISQSGPTPPWSKDTWSFVPLDLGELHAQVLEDVHLITAGQNFNMSVKTPALRARLQCSPLDYLSDKSLWLAELDFSNQTRWNDTNKPKGIDHGYTLKGYQGFANIGGGGVMQVACCANETKSGFGEAAVGYWSNLFLPAMGATDFTPIYETSTTAKWIVGRPLSNLYVPTAGDATYYVWIDEPKFAGINCTPIIEQANARVTIDVGTGVVQNYDILDIPQNASNAWSDTYLEHDMSVDYTGNFTNVNFIGIQSVVHNITVRYAKLIKWLLDADTGSYGNIFWDALMNSGRVMQALTPDRPIFMGTEDLDDDLFRFRTRGLNADFMSYSMLQLANNDKEALLDLDTLINLTDKTLGTFFKHFVSENVTNTFGGNAYQMIGERLPWSLGVVRGHIMKLQCLTRAKR
ncbi:unnamed protein product [Aureobasidium mustum]|uniref:Uncharacterized protein n=1 Tax=Aureobasidium mustum TaxID=2773714 RepID=A0A9N8JDA7_9PEZI|nr:unnamed protein product [Aureobasidium mustum]